MINNSQVAPLITNQFMVPRGEKFKETFKNQIEEGSEMFCIIETIASPTSESSPSDIPQFVGFTALWANSERGSRNSTFAIALVPRFWSKGYGTEITKFMINHAFVHMNMHRVSLQVYEGNDRAISLYERL